MPILSIRNVSKRFGGLQAVSDVSLDVEEGEIVGLIGPNGAGKTTFVNLLTGELALSSGEIEFAGEGITKGSVNDRCALGLLRTFQVPQPFLDLTVRDNVRVGALFGRGGRAGTENGGLDDDIQSALARVGLQDHAGQSPSSLTTAGLKRLELARCLAARPRVLLLDEPLGGLNASETKELLKTIRELKAAGVTMIFIEHIIPAVMSVSDRVVVLTNGRKLMEGLPQQVVSNPDVQKAYLGNVDHAIGHFKRERQLKMAAGAAR